MIPSSSIDIAARVDHFITDPPPFLSLFPLALLLYVCVHSTLFCTPSLTWSIFSSVIIFNSQNNLLSMHNTCPYHCIVNLTTYACSVPTCSSFLMTWFYISSHVVLLYLIIDKILLTGPLLKRS